MNTATAFGDVESLLVGFLNAATGVRVVTIVPANVETLVPVIQVDRVGGSDTVPSLDDCLVDVECFAADRISAKQLANQVRQLIRYQLPGYLWGAVSVARVLTSTGPAERPYGNPNVFRIGATYQITLHNHQ